MRYRERDEKKRAAFLEQLCSYSKECLVFVDESGIDQHLHRSHGWSKRGEVVFAEVSGKHYARESFIAAKCNSTILAPLCFQGTCNTKLFDLWVEQFLIPELKPGQIVILDNAASHKSQKTQALIERAGPILIL